MPAIETNSLCKRFGSLQAVSDVDLRVERGEVFGFLGPNGAGKSTTINVLLDFVRRSSGEVSVLGVDPEEEPGTVRARTGVLAEGAGFFARDTARDHLRFAARMQGVDDDADALLRRVGIADAADRAVGGFSKGMRQRLGLAVALVGEPDLLILDEPLAGLDPEGARLLREVVRTERDRGAAVFFSSHIMDQVEAVCDRVGIMHEGELVAVDTVAGLQAERGDRATLELRLVDPTEDAVDVVAGVDGVADATLDGEGLRVACAGPSAKAAAVAALDDAGVTVADIHEDRPSLEAVYRSITAGRDDP